MNYLNNQEKHVLLESPFVKESLPTLLERQREWRRKVEGLCQKHLSEEINEEEFQIKHIPIN